MQCLKIRVHQSPCNGGPPMTPNQLRFRASSQKDQRPLTLKASPRTPTDFENQAPTIRSILPIHPCNEHKIDDSQPIKAYGIGFQRLSPYTPRIVLGFQSKTSRLYFSFSSFLFLFLFLFGRQHWFSIVGNSNLF